MQTKIETAGLKRLGLKVSRAANFLGTANMRKILQDSGKDLLADIRAEVQTYTPGTVTDLTAKTKKYKQKQVGFIYPILYRTGEMLDAMISRVYAPRGGDGWSIKVSFPGTHTGGSTNEEIASAHINGTGHLPKRDFLKPSNAWRRRVLKRFSDALKGK